MLPEGRALRDVPADRHVPRALARRVGGDVRRAAAGRGVRRLPRLRLHVLGVLRRRRPQVLHEGLDAFALHARMQPGRRGLVVHRARPQRRRAAEAAAAADVPRDQVPAVQRPRHQALGQAAQLRRRAARHVRQQLLARQRRRLHALHGVEGRVRERQPAPVRLRAQGQGLPRCAVEAHERRRRRRRAGRRGPWAGCSRDGDGGAVDANHPRRLRGGRVVLLPAADRRRRGG